MITKIGDLVIAETEEEAVHIMIACIKEGIHTDITPRTVLNCEGNEVIEYYVRIKQ